jgi:ABC-type polysaccharide/polyol phosphate transport system ATPase subunit
MIEAPLTPAVVVRHLSKQYRIGRAGSGSLYDRAAQLIGRYQRTDAKNMIMALRDVSFTVPSGHVLGVLGRNGSGKSTLMKVLARVTAPTDGYAIVRGRVGALLQAGTGFHPELTGRDNIALSGAILGMTRQEVVAVRERIVEFAEIGRFLDTPVKHYSTGMYMRLAFSVSAHMQAEIMLVDEVLSVGDAAFQAKCQERIRSLVGEGRTVLFVSHSIASVRTICDTAIVLDSGLIRFAGPASDAVDFYEENMLGAASSARPQPQLNA